MFLLMVFVTVVVAMSLDIPHQLEFLQPQCFQKLDQFPSLGIIEARLLLSWVHEKELVLILLHISDEGKRCSL
jgi:hypothetical protein